ncbi:hypothetical protein BGT96224_A21522 [Blumeria graminis f. sp. tritici 96224]|uniref:Uncharacterized protein n=1 Tax=Blumeria graminis f. sp. tritici 96224 TaxID=1268274 RepID=A0A656KP09_BLUGR|nr:hypothetical protein BGT96224_A21522 [Blumeria graminis f. sp. tritici 96224]
MSGTNTSEAETENRIKDYKIAQLVLWFEALTTYAVKLLTDWEEYKEHGEDLFLLSKEEFADWTSDMFSKIKSPFEKRFRDYFHNNRVYTGKNATTIGIAMTNLLNAEELPEWPQVTEENVSNQSQILLQPTVMREQTIRELSEDQSLYSKTTTSRQKPRMINKPLHCVLHILKARIYALQ